MNLRGVVSFHGALGSFHRDPGSIKAKILVLHGAADVLVPDEQVGLQSRNGDGECGLDLCL